MVCVAMVAACGSSKEPPGSGARGGPLLAYAQCMRAHDVPNFPDPSARGGLVIPNDINAQSPAFESAQQSCSRLSQPSGGQTGSSEGRKLQLLALARCMRANGVPSFSDPTSSPPPPSGGNAIGANGWYLSLGTTQERQSPAYKRAAAACHASVP
jgi:hypothetical protein